MRAIKLACHVSLVLIAMGTAGQAQSLTELAKQEKDRKAKARTSGGPAKVYSDGASGEAVGSSETRGTFTVMSATSANETSAARPRTASTPFPDRRSFRDVSVTLYVTSWCPYCRKARALLSTLPNLKLITHDIEQSKAKRSEMLAKTGGETGIPVIDIEGTVLRGFSAAAITDAIGRARTR